MGVKHITEKFISKVLGKGIRIVTFPCGHSYSVEKGSGKRLPLRCPEGCEIEIPVGCFNAPECSEEDFEKLEKALSSRFGVKVGD